MDTKLYQVIPRAMLVWLAIIAAETIHGIARGLLLVPVTGDLRARQIGVFIGSLTIFAIAYLTIRWIGATRIGDLLMVGLLWVVFTIVFEFSLGIAIGLPWERIVSDYDIRAGGLMIAGLLFMFISPYLAARIKSIVLSDTTQ